MLHGVVIKNIVLVILAYGLDFLRLRFSKAFRAQFFNIFESCSI